MNSLLKIIKGVAPAIATLLGGPAAGAIVTVLGNTLLGNGDASPDEIAAALADPATLVKLKELDVQMATLVANQNIAQAGINQADASSGNKYQSYWRPTVGWICVGGLAIATVISPIVVALGGPAIQVDSNTLMTLLLGMLGMAGLRSYDKKQGTA